MEKKYDYLAAQQRTKELWSAQNTYDHTNHAGPLFAIDTPPPTVSGTLHIGHVFSYTQTDIIARHKRMQGNSVFYPFGFDDNGLPTERYVEKKCNVRAHTLKRTDFINLCLQESALAAEQFKSLWQTLAISANWKNTYSTISSRTRALSQLSFLKLLSQNDVYRRYEPAIYCTACRTSVAQAELDDLQKPTFFNTIIFKDRNGKDLLIGTTRPELLPSCVAVLYHPSDGRYQQLKDSFATTPIFNEQVPIFEDELVNPDKGTGLVMVCTFGDKTDIEWYKKYNLAYRQSIGFDGKMMAHTGSLAGLTILQAREKIIQELQQHHALITQQSIVHSVNVHERCKNPVEFLLIAQWFVRILNRKQELLAKADLIHWYPTFMKSRYIDWVENLGWDWGISRQRMYGIPFPVWHCADCQKILTARPEQLPIDPQETAYHGPCTECGGKNIVPDTDVMDTWNTSSLTPYIVYDLYQPTQDPFDKSAQEFLPMAMRPQAHDIIRTWAFDTIVKALLHHDIIPWQNIVISGHVLSEQKEKISKSKGNESYTPDRLLQEFSADAVRYWTASGHLGHDVSFSVDQLKIGNRLVTKLWNAFLFAQPHISGEFDRSKTMTNLGIVNEWLLHRLTITEDAYHKALDAYEFSPSLQSVEQFFWTDYCDNYIELVKHMLFNPHEYDAHTVTSTQWTLYHVGLRLLQLYAPYLPVVTETIYQELYVPHAKTSSLHATKFADYRTSYVFESSAAYVGKIIEIASTVRKLKTEQQLSLKTALHELTIYVDDEMLMQPLRDNERMLRGVTQAQHIIYKLSDATTVLNILTTNADGSFDAIVIV